MSEDQEHQDAKIAVNVATGRPPLAGIVLNRESVKSALESPQIAGDFRGACLNNVALTGLNLSGCQFGPASGDTASSDLHIFRALAVGTLFNKCDLSNANFRDADLKQSNLEGANVQGATFTRADLRGAFVGNIHVEDGDFTDAWLDEVDLSDAKLLRVNMSGARLTGSDLGGADLSGADLYDTQLDGAFFGRALLISANLCDAHGRHVLFPGATLARAKMSGVNLPNIVLRKAVLDKAHLDHSQLHHADMSEASARGTSLQSVHLEDAVCYGANFSGANLRGAHLERADLRGVTFDPDTKLTGTRFAGAFLHGVQWRGVDISTTDLMNLRQIGDEKLALEAPLAQRAAYYRQASEAYGALTFALLSSSLSRASVFCHYRAALMERRAALCDFLTSVFFIAPQEPPTQNAHSKQSTATSVPLVLRIWRFLNCPLYFARWFGTFILGLIAGYGDAPWRALASYAIVLVSFAVGNFVVGAITGHPLSPLASAILSVTSFHGRGFNSTNLTLDTPLAAMSAVEAALGAFIELLFVAAFTRRFIGTRG